MKLAACVLIYLIATLTSVEGQINNGNNDPGLFFAIITVVVIIAIVLVGAIISLVIICIVYYCCTPVPLPPEPQPNVRSNPNTQTPQNPSPYLTETLPPDYQDHEQYPRSTLSQRSRNSLPRYSLIFKKNKNRRISERSQNSVDQGTASIPDHIELPQDTEDNPV